jgi:hypothetical protein
MSGPQFSPRQVNKVRRFTADVLRPSTEERSNPLAIQLFRRYKGSEIPELASQYAESLNGSRPKTKERILAAVREFRSISGLVENVLRPTSNGELCADDFLPPDPLGGRTAVRLL